MKRHSRRVAGRVTEPQPAPRRILLVCGSLQRRSSNRAALDVALDASIARGAVIDDFQGLAMLPAFDPDLQDIAPAVVADWRARIEAADGLLIAAPEYAGAIAGAVKNAFDWLVGFGSMYRKPVAVISAGTSGGWFARQMLAQTLTWQGAYVVAELGISAPRTKSDAEGHFNDEATITSIEQTADLLLDAISMPPANVAARATAVTAALQISGDHIAPVA